MRLLTWNCNRGDIDQRVDRLQSLSADVIALQECRKPTGDSESVLWRGTLEEQGVAVVSTNPDLRIEPLIVPAHLPGTVLPVIVHAPEPFILINVWAVPEPTYEAFTLSTLAVCVVGASLPIVVMGDFNSTPIVESQRRTSRELLRRMRDEFGLVSAYHAHLGIEHGREPHPTFFLNRQENRPFHIDYSFVPETWQETIRSVEVGAFGEWPDSDHRPMTMVLQR